MTDGDQLVDTNVFVHAYILLDPKKQASAREVILLIWEQGGGITTLQNLCEFFFVATRRVRRPMAVDQASGIVREFLRSPRWRVLDRGQETIIRAMELVKLHRIPFWDALIAACMLEHGVDTIVTENERDFKRICGITVINPFKSTVRP